MHGNKCEIKTAFPLPLSPPLHLSNDIWLFIFGIKLCFHSLLPCLLVLSLYALLFPSLFVFPCTLLRLVGWLIVIVVPILGWLPISALVACDRAQQFITLFFLLSLSPVLNNSRVSARFFFFFLGNQMYMLLHYYY